MDSLEGDLKDIQLEISEYSKLAAAAKSERTALQFKITILEESLKEAQSSEERMGKKLTENQKTIENMQKVLEGYVNIKEDNALLQLQIKNFEELLEQEKVKNKVEKEKWINEKDDILNANREELENMKKIRNMEVSSLNREISHLQEDNERKMEMLKSNLENEYKSKMAQTIMEYEEKLAKLSRDLLTSQSELKNSRQSSATRSQVYDYNQVIESRPLARERYIPQPLAFVRCKPVAPIYCSASQVFKEREDGRNSAGSPPEKLESPVQTKKKRKLYTKTDDL